MLKEDLYNNVINKAELKTTQKSSVVKNIKKTKSVTMDFKVYNIPNYWIELIKQDGIAISSFAKQAMREKLKKDGLL